MSKGIPTKYRSEWRSKPFNQVMRATRIAAGLTMAELAQQTGIGKLSLAGFENLRHYPSTSQQEAIAKVLQRSLNELFPPWHQVFVATTYQRKYDPAPEDIVPLQSLGDRALLRLDWVDPADLATDSLRQVALRQMLDSLLGCLQANRRRVLQLRYGWYGRALSLNEVAGLIGVLRNKVWQRERAALQRLHDLPHTKRLDDFRYEDRHWTTQSPRINIVPYVHPPAPKLFAQPLKLPGAQRPSHSTDLITVWPPPFPTAWVEAGFIDGTPAVELRPVVVEPWSPQNLYINKQGQAVDMADEESNRRPWRLKPLLVAPGVLTKIGRRRFVDGLPVVIDRHK